MKAIQEKANQPQRKQGKNAWLMDLVYLNTLEFEDNYYLRKLGRQIFFYLKTIPIAVSSAFDPKAGSIVFKTGGKQRYFHLSPALAPESYIALLDRWTSKFFPHYELEITTERALTRDELYQGFTSGEFSFDEGIHQSITDTRVESGRVTKAVYPKDEFHVTRSEKREVRLSTMPVQILLRGLAELSSVEGNDKQVRDLLLENSKYLRSFNERTRAKEIGYRGIQLINFFILNKALLKSTPPEVLDHKGNQPVLQFGNEFVVTFESITHAQDCMDVLSQKRSKLIFHNERRRI